MSNAKIGAAAILFIIALIAYGVHFANMPARGYRRRDGEWIPDTNHERFKYLPPRAKRYYRMYKDREVK